MNSDLASNIAPLFEVYGSVCFDAQHLEKGIKLLISLSDPDNSFTSRYEKMTLGDLHKLVRDKNYFTDAETRIINVAIKERNILIHHCWENYIQRAMTSAGRDELRSEIIQKKNCILKASKIIDDFIDNHIEKYKMSLSQLGDDMLYLLSDHNEKIIH